MTIPTITLFLIAATASATPAQRIIGGEPVSIDKYPAILQLEILIYSKWTFQCGGNIINKNYIVSAAHCFFIFHLSPSNTRWRAGTSTREEKGVVLLIQKIINHPKYDEWTATGNDISLVRLTAPITFTSVIQPIALPPQDYEVPDNADFHVVGWGSTAANARRPSHVLRHVKIKYVNWEECQRRYKGELTKNMICAGILDVGGKGPCSGDSGGPGYYNNTLVGIASWLKECADNFYPSVWTKVSAYSNWIRDNMV